MQRIINRFLLPGFFRDCNQSHCRNRDPSVVHFARLTLRRVVVPAQPKYVLISKQNIQRKYP